MVSQVPTGTLSLNNQKNFVLNDDDQPSIIHSEPPPSGNLLSQSQNVVSADEFEHQLLEKEPGPGQPQMLKAESPISDVKSEHKTISGDRLPVDTHSVSSESTPVQVPLISQPQKRQETSTSQEKTQPEEAHASGFEECVHTRSQAQKVTTSQLNEGEQHAHGLHAQPPQESQEKLKVKQESNRNSQEQTSLAQPDSYPLPMEMEPIRDASTSSSAREILPVHASTASKDADAPRRSAHLKARLDDLPVLSGNECSSDGAGQSKDASGHRLLAPQKPLPQVPHQTFEEQTSPRTAPDDASKVLQRQKKRESAIEEIWETERLCC